MLPRMILILALGALFIPSIVSARTESPRQEGKIEELRKLRRDKRKKESELDTLKKAAGRGGDAKIQENKRKTQDVQAEIDSLGQSIGRLVPEVVQGLLKDLTGTAPEAWTRAKDRLAEVGTPAIPELEAVANSGKTDEQLRARDAIKQIRSVEAGDNGLWKQWAASATASSEYGDGSTEEHDWSAREACGPPDTEGAGDKTTAWASKEADGGDEWLELTYKSAVRPTRVRIHETFNPGAVVKIEALDTDKKWRVLWSGVDNTAEAPAYLDVQFDPPNFVTRVIRVTLDSAGFPGWNEIDAVQLIGEPAIAPAKPDPAKRRPGAVDPKKRA